jgi:hypothetical protein
VTELALDNVQWHSLSRELSRRAREPRLQCLWRLRSEGHAVRAHGVHNVRKSDRRRSSLHADANDGKPATWRIPIFQILQVPLSIFPEEVTTRTNRFAWHCEHLAALTPHFQMFEWTATPTTSASAAWRVSSVYIVRPVVAAVAMINRSVALVVRPAERAAASTSP